MSKPRATGKRPTGGGGSLAGFGVSVSTATVLTDKDILQALVTFLEDRRVLFNPEYLEVASQVDTSVLEIRKELTEALQQVAQKSRATISLRAMRAACWKYLDTPREQFRFMGGQLGPRVVAEPGFFVALGELRGVLGAELKRLDDLFGLDIEPHLRAIFPREDQALTRSKPPRTR